MSAAILIAIISTNILLVFAIIGLNGIFKELRLGRVESQEKYSEVIDKLREIEHTQAKINKRGL